MNVQGDDADALLGAGAGEAEAQTPVEAPQPDEEPGAAGASDASPGEEPASGDGADAGPADTGDGPDSRQREEARLASAWAAPEPDVPAAGPTFSFGFNLQKVPGQGEDADPILRNGRDLGLVGVFDGMGGAGGTTYATPDGPRTGAYLASRVARDVVEERMLALLDPDWNLDGPAAARDLQRSVKRALAETLVGLNAPASGLRSRLLRALPTTMALMALQRRDVRDAQWAAHVLWSGDSRVYVFSPGTGAHQLSRDDLRDPGDALGNLRQDSTVSNAMSADTDFVVHHHQVPLTAPFLAVAATDGCFGYLRTPIHFEYLVLGALQEAGDTESWSALLQQRITAVTGDDAAMGLLGVGATYAEFRRLFAARTAELLQRCIGPLDEAAAEVDRAEHSLAEARRRHAALQTSLWGGYKPHYEQYLASEDQP